MNGLLFPSSRHKMPLSLPLGESAPQTWGRGGREAGKWPVTLCCLPLPPYGDRRAQCDPEASPGPGTVCPLSPGQGAIWGHPRATGARGRGTWVSGMLAWRVGRDRGKDHNSLGTVGVGRQAAQQAFRPVPLPR